MGLLLPRSVDEAARLDGATTWRRLRHVTLPLLLPAVAASVVINLIGGLKLFDLVRVLTGGGPGSSTESLSTLIARLSFDDQDAGYAAAVGVLLFLLIAGCTLGLNAFFSRRLRGLS